MATKKKASLGKAILSLLIAVPTIFSLFNKIITLIGLEARLAGRSLVLIIIFSFAFSIILTSTWLCMLAMLFMYLTSIQWSWQLAFLLLIALNLVLLFLFGFALIKTKNNLSFPVTRKHFHASVDIDED